MPFTLTVAEQGHVLHVVYTDPWTLDDVRTVIARSEHYFNQVDFRVHTLVDISATRMTPSMLGLRDVLILTHRNIGAVAIVGAARAYRIIVELIFQFYKLKHYGFFNSEDEGWCYLRKLIANENDPAMTEEL
jgi:hypothetical protein